MKVFRLIAKGGWLFVVIGFFLPMFPEGISLIEFWGITVRRGPENLLNGIELAIHIGGFGAFCLYAILVIAVIGCLGVIRILNNEHSANDLIFLVPNVILGVLFCISFGYGEKLESGNIWKYKDIGVSIILVGWIIVLLSTIVYMVTDGSFGNSFYFLHDKRHNTPSYSVHRVPNKNLGKDSMIEIEELNICVSNTPVTQQLYESIIGKNPSHFNGENRPVEFISWYDAIEFCNKLSEKEGLEKAYSVDNGNVKWNKNSKGYRLLTSNEWELAARSGERYKYSGSKEIDDVAWYNDNSGGETHNVAEKEPNANGLYDMTGNVWEWVWDGYDSGKYCLACGGSWGDIEKSCVISKRSKCHPDSYYVSVGMRVARSM